MTTMEFKTNLDSAQRVHKAACQLCKLRGVCRWSVDLEHEDHVLRVKADQVNPATVTRALTKAGLVCQVRNAVSPVND